MVMSSSPVLVPETVLILKDRLKHGQNVTKILESQVDTAQQNILLLQGQVRLANETICNLKKHFQDTEKLLSKLFETDPLVRAFDSDIKEVTKETPPKVPDHSAAISPVQDSGTESNKSFDDKNAENNKSPYAQQLRQVLDVLQDEETRKCGASSVHHSEPGAHKECACSECQLPSQKHFVDVVKDCNCGNANCVVEHYNKHDDYCKVKHKVNGHSNSHEVSPKSFPRSEASHIQTSSYPSHCSGPCCSSTEPPTYKIVEKTTPPVHYISVHSPVHVADKPHSSERHHQGHCGEKCQCHAFVNYVPYGYHLIESAPGIPESIQPISPSARRKRSYVPLLPGEEPPNLKYTKIKRIDGNKLNAQKMLQDFTKRRFLSYNPRYDLDLLIVPPPIPAYDLIKEGGKYYKSQKQSLEEYMPDHQSNNSIPETNENVNGVNPSEENEFNTINSGDQNTSATDNDTEAITTVVCSNGNNIYNDSNNNNSNSNMNDVSSPVRSSSNNGVNSITNNGFMHSLFKSPSSHVKLLPIIKEENIEGRKKLESLLPSMRGEAMKRNGASLINQECSYSMGLKQERNMSPITVGSNRT